MTLSNLTAADAAEILDSVAEHATESLSLIRETGSPRDLDDAVSAGDLDVLKAYRLGSAALREQPDVHFVDPTVEPPEDVYYGYPVWLCLLVSLLIGVVPAFFGVRAGFTYAAVALTALVLVDLLAWACGLKNRPTHR